MSSQKWKELAEKRRLVGQYYQEKDKAIKDYKFRRSVSSDFYERVAKPVTEKIGEQIKKKTGGTGREDDRANAGASIARTRNTKPKRSPQDTLQTQIKVLIIIGYQINIKKVSELVEIKNDADRLHELRKARDMAATEVRNYGYKARAVDETKKLRWKKRFILIQKKISKNIVKTLRFTTKQRGFLLQNQQREQDSKQVGIHIR